MGRYGQDLTGGRKDVGTASTTAPAADHARGRQWGHPDPAGPHLHVMFHPDRKLLGREDGIERPSIVVAVAGKREQALRFDPFSAGSHYHIRPSLRGRQIPLWTDDGQRPLDVALAFFEKPLRFRGLLAQAGEDEVACQLTDGDLAAAARQIREVYAAAHQSPAGLLARLERIEQRLARIEAQITPS